MRSGVGPVLVLMGLAVTAVLVLVLFGSLAARSELEDARAEIAALRAQVEAMEPGIGEQDLVERLDELEESIHNALLTTGLGGDGASPAAGDPAAMVDRLDEIIERLEELDARVDEICGNVPVC